MSAPAKPSRNTAEYIIANGMKVDYCVEDMKALKKRVKERCKEWGLEAELLDAESGLEKLDPSVYNNYSTPENYFYFNMAQLLNVTAEYDLDGSKVPYKLPYIKIDKYFQGIASKVMMEMQKRVGSGIKDLDIAYSEIIKDSNSLEAFVILAKLPRTDPIANLVLYSTSALLKQTTSCVSALDGGTEEGKLALYLIEDYQNRVGLLEASSLTGFAPSQFSLGVAKNDLTAHAESAAKGYIPAQFMLLKNKGAEEFTDEEKDQLLAIARKAHQPAQQLIIKNKDSFEGKVKQAELDEYDRFIKNTPDLQQEDEAAGKKIGDFLKRTRDRDRGGAVAAVSEVGFRAIRERARTKRDGDPVSALGVMEGGDATVAMEEGVAPEVIVAQEVAQEEGVDAIEGAAAEGTGGTGAPVHHQAPRRAGTIDEMMQNPAENIRIMKIADILADTGADDEMARKEAAALTHKPTPPPTTEKPQGDNVSSGFLRGRRIGGAKK